MSVGKSERECMRKRKSVCVCVCEREREVSQQPNTGTSSPMLLTDAPLDKAQWRVGLGISSPCDTATPVSRLKHTLTHRAGEQHHRVHKWVTADMLYTLYLLIWMGQRDSCHQMCWGGR